MKLAILISEMHSLDNYYYTGADQCSEYTPSSIAGGNAEVLHGAMHE